MGRISGVLVNTTGGEGHMTAIRQPLSTAPVYLYLEDGIPTRSTGFFNHNALYEVNLPQAERIEVMKGPASALYGSDAIGGVINVGTKRPSNDPTGNVSLEGGEFGYRRFLGTVSGKGLNADLNLTQTDGWRTGTDYDRQSGTLRWDRLFSDAVSLKTVATFSNINQATAGTSALSRDDFENDPTANYTPISFRDVTAFRLNSALETQAGAGTLSLTPYFRFNSMDLLPNWSLTFDPAIWETENTSFGLLTKYGVNLPSNVRVVGGVDLDYSPGSRFEQSIIPTRTDGIFVDYTIDQIIYDYDVTFAQAAPYVQADYEAGQVTLSGGVRADFIRYDYTNNLSVEETGDHRRPADATPTFSDVTPKFGLTYNPIEEFGVFASYRHGFRAPSEGQLFRQGRADNTVDLNAVDVRSTEVGFRGVINNMFSYELSGYYMPKTNDILTFRHPDGSTETVNAGETLHRGLEAQLGVRIVQGLRLDVAYSYAKHTYEDWVSSSGDFTGNEMEFAPRQIGNVVLEYELPRLAGSSVSFEWNRLGSYYEDASNDNKYEGHDLFNARALIPLGGNLQLFGRLQNIMDKRYAERASFNPFRGEELAPGLPRTVYIGFRVTGGLGL
jgi:outer membrane receptor protein involved in Fe transport